MPMMFIFMFKQKAEYELRISDWSSDVCSSDLLSTLRRDTLCTPPSHRTFKALRLRITVSAPMPCEPNTEPASLLITPPLGHFLASPCVKASGVASPYINSGNLGAWGLACSMSRNVFSTSAVGLPPLLAARQTVVTGKVVSVRV